MHESPSPDLKEAADLLEALLFIRLFEQGLVSLFREGRLRGTTHSCVGQELAAVATMQALGPDDYVVSSHRGHGHFLAYGGPPEALLRELMGQEAGLCGGRGGSQHLQWRGFYSNGITGGMAPVATGMAQTLKRRGSTGIAVACLGDGALGQGVVYESLNMAALYSLPILFMVENNLYAMSTHVEQALAGTFEGRAAAFGIPCHRFAGDQPLALCASVREVINDRRATGGPAMIVFDTYRFDGHSKSDPCDYRSRDEEASWRERDPVHIIAAGLPPETVDAVEARCQERVATLQARAAS